MNSASPLSLNEPTSSIAPGAQSFFQPGGPVGVLIIHGYGGTIGDYRRFAEALHQRGYTVMGARLAGHGESLSALRATGWRDWQASVVAAAQELRRHCREIIVVGSSFGGALAINYARNFPDRIRGLVVVNPAIRYRAGGKFQTLALRLLRLFTKDYRKPGLTADDRQRYAQLGSMTHWPIDGVFETYHYIQTMVIPHLGQISTPALVMAMPDDPVVHADSARIIHQRLGSAQKKLVWMPGKTHRPFRDSELVRLMVTEIENYFGT